MDGNGRSRCTRSRARRAVTSASTRPGSAPSPGPTDTPRRRTTRHPSASWSPSEADGPPPPFRGHRRRSSRRAVPAGAGRSRGRPALTDPFRPPRSPAGRSASERAPWPASAGAGAVAPRSAGGRRPVPLVSSSAGWRSSPSRWPSRAGPADRRRPLEPRIFVTSHPLIKPRWFEYITGSRCPSGTEKTDRNGCIPRSSTGDAAPVGSSDPPVGSRALRPCLG